MSVVSKVISCVKKGSGLSVTAVKTNLSSNFNRKTDSAIETSIGEIWEKRVERNPRLYNGSKFRMHTLDEQRTPVLLALGVTSYRDYLGTNCADGVDELRGRGEREHGNGQAYLSDALAVGALVMTADEKAVFLRRSDHCGEAQGLLDRPGGHPEPEMVPGMEGELENVSGEAVVAEIFDSILREVIDEVNIPREQLSMPQLLGFVYNSTTGFRPSAEFLIRCQLTETEVLQLFKRGDQPEADESTDILFMTVEELQNVSKLHVHPWEEMSPSAQAALHMYLEVLH